MLALDNFLMNFSLENFYWAVFKEYIAAIGVLALILLSFAHHPIGRDEVYRYADGSVAIFCGSVPVQGQSSAEGQGCDACRISSGAAIPDTPCAQPHQFTLETKVVFTISIGLGLFQLVSGNSNPRAPPNRLNI